MRRPDIAAIKAHREWSIRRWQLSPVSWTAVDKTTAFFTQGIFRALSHTQEVIAECDRIKFLIYWKRVFQQFRRDTVSEQGCEFRLQIE